MVSKFVLYFFKKKVRVKVFLHSLRADFGPTFTQRNDHTDALTQS